MSPQQQHLATANVASAALSPIRLNSDITQHLMSPRQHHRQQNTVTTSRHDQRRLGSDIMNIASAATSRHGQRRLDSAIASKTQQRHYAMANIASATPMPARLSSNITPAIVASAAPSPKRLGSNIAP
jgi:hypothetical protein